MEDTAWKLGANIDAYDNLLDGITFEDLILAVHCNCRKINRVTVMRELREILESRIQDMEELLTLNMLEIIKEARKGRK